MGLDWLPMAKPKPGAEEEFELRLSRLEKVKQKSN